MNAADDILDRMKRFICSNFSAEERGIGAYLIHTGFMLPDGDEVHIVLRDKGGDWVLTDDGHRSMWLSYEDFKITPSREAVLQKTLDFNKIGLRDGVLSVRVSADDADAALRSMVQVQIQIADLLYLNRRNVRNTFSEDVKDMLSEYLGGRCVFNKKISVGEETYLTDAYLDGDVPMLIFTVSSTERCLDATCAIMAFADDHDFTSLVFVDDNAEIGKEALKRINNRSDKLFLGIPERNGEFSRFLRKQGISVRIRRSI